MSPLGYGLSSLSQNFRGGVDLMNDIYRERRQQEIADLINELNAMKLAEVKRGIEERKGLADLISSRQAAGDYTPTTSTKLTPEERPFVISRSTDNPSLISQEDLMSMGLMPKAGQFLKGESFPERLKEQTTTIPAKRSMIGDVRDFHLSKGNIDQALAAEKELRLQQKEKIDEIKSVASIDGRVAERMWNNDPELVKRSGGPIKYMGKEGKWSLFGNEESGILKIHDTTGETVEVKKGTGKDKNPNEWNIREKAAAGDKQAQAVLDKKLEEEKTLVREKAKTDPMLLLLKRDELKVAEDRRKEFTKRRDEYEDKLTKAAERWAENYKDDPTQANEIWNQEKRSLERQYKDLWESIGSGQQKQVFKLEVPADGIIDGKTWTNIEAMYKQEAGASATKQGFAEFIKKIGVKGVRNVAPQKEASTRKPLTPADSNSRSTAASPAKTAPKVEEQEWTTAFGQKPGRKIQKLLKDPPVAPWVRSSYEG